MTPFVSLSAIAAPLPLPNVDTDQILPKQFLKTIEREGLKRGLFFDFRFDEQGQEKPDFILNRVGYRDAGILLAGPNFGCGSSREHAPWALFDFGIRCVIAPSFADIFRANCINNGLLPIMLPSVVLDELMEQSGQPAAFSIDLPTQTITTPGGHTIDFDIDPIEKRKLLNGLDAIGATLLHQNAINAYERRSGNAYH